MDPQLASLATTALGGVIGPGGSWFGSWWTERHARRERKRRACQAILRLLPQIDEALDAESKIDVADDRYDALVATVDRLAVELAVLATDLLSEDRQRLDQCAEALVQRELLGPSPAAVGRRATWTVRALVTARLGKQQVATWTNTALKDFADGLALVYDTIEENYRSRQQHEREERERQKQGDAGSSTQSE